MKIKQSLLGVSLWALLALLLAACGGSGNPLPGDASSPPAALPIGARRAVREGHSVVNVGSA